MRYYFEGIIVVEGKEDSSYLSSFITAEYVITNGYELPNEEIDYLNEASKHNQILVLVDPDDAGREIEKKLNNKLLKATYLNVEISKCNRGQKSGVAECDQEEILKILNPYLTVEKSKNSGVLQEKSLKIELSNKLLRQHIASKYHLGKCNNKTLFKRLGTLKICEEDLRNSIKEYRDGN